MMKNRETGKYLTLLNLYLAQSIPMSFFSTVVPVIMRMEHYSLESIGYLQLVKLPWILKFLWAPMIDKTAGTSRKYRRWIIFSELFYAMVISCIGFFSLQTDFKTIIALMVIAFTASATQDIATDAFAILNLKKEERSLGNSMQSAGSFLGTLVGSGILLIVYNYLGWNCLLWTLALCVIFAIIPLSLYRLKNREPEERPASAKSISFFEFVHFFRQKGIIFHVLILMIFYSGIIGILTMLKPYLVDLGYEVKEIGFIAGIFGTAIGSLMTLPAGFFIRKKGLKKSVFLFSSINIIAAAYFLFLTYSSHGIYLIYIGVALLWSAYAMSSVFIYTMSMNIVRQFREGSDFTLQIVITHLSSLIIAVSSGKIADAITYRGLFAIELVICVLILVALPFIFKEKFYEK
ncbi:MAG: MFS transporter [Bacteroidetes bacterium GWF2_42_66]|nr:MAG: MFS transporter [Bacteroidetes bacterium GWA2_42_15]OFX97922.1 MAG: MFS transporter [Bacteroidetes bacterium GWE2_42_39]OFY45840.1 MAG: MFS transporter [Bacteroidetes bacterium GWF2_42_66]